MIKRHLFEKLKNKELERIKGLSLDELYVEYESWFFIPPKGKGRLIIILECMNEFMSFIIDKDTKELSKILSK